MPNQQYQSTGGNCKCKFNYVKNLGDYNFKYEANKNQITKLNNN